MYLITLLSFRPCLALFFFMGCPLVTGTSVPFLGFTAAGILPFDIAFSPGFFHYNIISQYSTMALFTFFVVLQIVVITIIHLHIMRVGLQLCY